jgi:GH24 family phage-related lysozyme (muramidase)
MNKAVEFIKKEEGCRLKAYQDSVGIWTIGYGTILTNDRAVKQDDAITQEEADQFLQSNLNDKWNAIKPMIKKPLNENQQAAILSLVYNIGVGAFSTSTVLKKININQFDATIRDAFMMWVKAGGKTLQGLINRRTREADLYFKTSSL